MAIDTETMQVIERCVARAVSNATSLKGAADEIAKGVTQYVGARYVPLFAEPLEWDNTKAYEPLTIVLHQGNSYTSRQYVPVGVEIENDSFWALTGNYNAQVEQYRQEVKTFDGRITANANAIETETTNRTEAVTAEVQRAQSAERVLQTNIDAEKNRAEDAEQTLHTNIDAEKNRAEGAEQTLHTNIDNEIKRATKMEKTGAFIIGNSYTAGFDDTSRTHSVASIADKVFDNAYVRGASAAGFLSYTDHQVVFEDLLNTLINENSDKLDTITHVIFNSAIGDSRAYIEKDADSWRANMKQTLNSIVDTIHNRLPRCKYIGICYMESIDRNYRTYNDIYETFTDFVNVGRQLFGMCSTNKYLTFMGFAGWNIVGTKYMNNDHIHPNYAGYDILTSNWLDCLNGTPTYYPIYNTIECPIDDSFGGAKFTLKNYCMPERDDLFVDQDFSNATNLITTDPITIVDNNDSYMIMLNSVTHYSEFQVNVDGTFFKLMFSQTPDNNLRIKLISHSTEMKSLRENIPVGTNYLVISDYIYG